MAKSDKGINGLFSKYKKESDGFKTRSIEDLKKERENIKKGYYKKGALLFVVTLVAIALFKMITGDYEARRAGNHFKPIEDHIEVKEGEPSIAIIKDQIEQMKKQQEAMRQEYEKKVQESSQKQQKKIKELEEALKKAEEEARKKPKVVANAGDNNASENVAEVRNELLYEIAKLKESIDSMSHKNEKLPSILEKPTPPPVQKKEIVAENYEIESLEPILEEKEEEDQNTSKDTIEFSIVTGLSKALLITGVQAPTFAAGTQNPKPVLVSFNSDILLPNDRAIDIKECTGLGSAVGNMNTKRAEIAISKLNCIVERDGKTYKVEEKVQAYLIGEDGAYGLSGRLVDSGAKVVVKELMVGFLQGVNQAFQTAVQPQYTTTVGVGGGGVGTYPSAGDAMRYGAVAGTNTGLNALAEYYQKMMDGLYPTISVRAGREVGVLWRGGESIKLKATRVFSVEGKERRSEKYEPFATEADEELDYEAW